MMVHTHMKSSKVLRLGTLAIMVLAMLAGFSGCGSPPKKEEAYELPKTYPSAMAEAKQRLLTIDRLVIGSRFQLAKKEAWILENVVKKMKDFEPQRRVESPEEYIEFISQVEDLLRTSSWLHYYVERHTKADAIEQLNDFIERYNRLVMEFGPSGQRIEAPPRPKSVYAMPESYRAVVPGERIYR